MVDSMEHWFPSGFTLWHGGENPVPGKSVFVVCRTEAEIKKYIKVSPSPSEQVRWKHTGEGGDVLAYKEVDTRRLNCDL